LEIFVIYLAINKNYQQFFSAGGLVTAVAPVVIECKGTWVGWPGIYDMTPNEAIPESDSGDQAPTAGLTSSQVCFHNYGWNNLVTIINYFNFRTGRASQYLKGQI
jgi:trehalose-6-phosphate synthase